MTLLQISDRCTGCGACLATCPPRALSPARGRPEVDDALCTGCLACVEVCPADAITFAAPRGSGRGRSRL